jgi:hypothetical protein
MTLAHLLKLLLFLELLTTTAISAVLLQYLDQPWYWVLDPATYLDRKLRLIRHQPGAV